MIRIQNRRIAKMECHYIFKCKCNRKAVIKIKNLKQFTEETLDNATKTLADIETSIITCRNYKEITMAEIAKIIGLNPNLHQKITNKSKDYFNTT